MDMVLAHSVIQYTFSPHSDIKFETNFSLYLQSLTLDFPNLECKLYLYHAITRLLFEVQFR